jgi:hypothetical protein
MIRIKKIAIWRTISNMIDKVEFIEKVPFKQRLEGGVEDEGNRYC